MVEIVKNYQIHRDHDPSAYIKAEGRYPHTDSAAPNQHFNGLIASDEIMNKAIEIARKQMSPHEAYLDIKAMTKWCLADQGGTFDYAHLTNKLNEYYEKRTCDITRMRETVARVAHYVINTDPDYEYRKKSSYSHIRDDLTARQLYDAIIAQFSHYSNGSIEYDGDRRDKKNVIHMLKVVNLDSAMLDTLIGGMRYKDAKYRNIFNDPLSNYAKEWIHYATCFEWWNTFQSDKRYSDLTVAELIIICDAMESYAGDYAAMDQHLACDAAKETLELPMTVLSFTENERAEIRYFTDELYTTPLLVGDEVWFGEHNTFSGIYPTHDIEGLQNFIIHVSTSLDCGLKPTFHVHRLKRNEVFFLICGDDSGVLFGKKTDRSRIDMFPQTHARIAGYFGQVLELSKVDRSSEVLHFCKMTFALNNGIKGFKKVRGKLRQEVPYPIYSIAKAIHNLRAPESIPHFTDKRMLLHWFCMIMDCAYGCVGWANAVQYLIAHIADRAILDISWEPSQDDISQLCKDWWFDMFGNKTLKSSKTFIFISQLLSK